MNKLTSGGRYKFHKQILRCSNYRIWKLPHPAECSYHRAELVLAIVYLDIVERAILLTCRQQKQQQLDNKFDWNCFMSEMLRRRGRASQ